MNITNKFWIQCSSTLALGFLLVISPPLWAKSSDLTGKAAEIYTRAKQGHWYQESEKLTPEIIPTSDGLSFFVIWTPTKNVPQRWIVSIHGSNGFATDDLAIWSKSLQGREVGLICLQWWIGTDDSTQSYYRPQQIYREIDLLLQKRNIAPGSVMFHGFSRGSANSYAIAALDSGRGRKYFALNVASSGRMNLDYPPNQAIVSGKFGDHPLRGTRWITVAGALDSNPERDGITGMKQTATWLQEQGATVVESIEDPHQGHGALQTNQKNAEHVIDLFLSAK